MAGQTTLPDVHADVDLEGLPVRASLRPAISLLTWQPRGHDDGHGSLSTTSSSSSQPALGSRTGEIDLAQELLGLHAGASTIMLRLYNPKDVNGGSCSCFDGFLQQKQQQQARVRQVLLDFRDARDHSVWVETLEQWQRACERPRRLLVIVNPCAGKGMARRLYTSQVEPLFHAAGVVVTITETQHHRHAIDIGRTMDIAAYDGVACVSGDGIVTEVLNGLLQRDDWDKAVKMRLGHIPGGSGNGIAMSTMVQGDVACTAANAAWAIITGKSSLVDVVTVSQASTQFHCVLNVNWGLVSDVDIESERYRWMGGFRLTAQTLVRTANLRRYVGTLDYLPADANVLDLNRDPNRTRARDGSGGSGAEKVLRAEYKREDGGGFVGARVIGEEERRRGGWRSMSGEFVLLWAQNMPWAATDMPCTPHAKLADGCMDVLVVRDVTPWQLLSLFLAMEKGDHINSPHCTYLKVRAFTLTPGRRTKGKVPGGLVVADGEVLAGGVGAEGDRSHDLMSYERPFDVTVAHGLARVFSS